MDGNFLEYAGAKLGVDVGFGKCILVYPQKTEVSLLSLTATAINTAIQTGNIVGVIRGWHTIVGAPVGETSVERTGTSEMKLIREEIAADTLTFEANMQNRAVISDLVKAGSLNCILLDDQGNAFGEYNVKDLYVSTMLLNFSTKVTSSFQRDNVTDKTIAVTVRYLVKELSYLDANVETELITKKIKGEIKVISVIYSSVAAETTVEFKIVSNDTGEILKSLGDYNIDVTLDGVVATVSELGTTTDGVNTLVLTEKSQVAGSGKITLAVSADEFYTYQAIMPSSNYSAP